MEASIEFIDKPYVSAADIPVARLERMLCAGERVKGAYFLCVQPEGRFILELIPGTEFAKAINGSKRYRIIGVAGNRAQAFELTRRVLEDYMSGGRDISGLGEYLRRMEKGGGGDKDILGDS